MDNILQQLGFLAEHDVAALLGVEVSTLRNWRSKGHGPAYSRAGGQMLYPIEGLKSYLVDNVVTPAPAPTLADPAPRRPGRPRKQGVTA